MIDKVPKLMADLLAGTEFEQSLRVRSAEMADRDFRGLVFAYCKRYQDVYWFDQLENAFAYLEMVPACDPDEMRSELASVRIEVDEAMGEYFLSLNEVGAVINRLLDDTPFTIDDVISCVSHVWNAHACNEQPDEFRAREDQILCDLLINDGDVP